MSGLLLSEQVPYVWWRSRRRRWGVMGIELLLRLQGALGAAQWEHQQQAENCTARHVGYPLVPANEN